LAVSHRVGEPDEPLQAASMANGTGEGLVDGVSNHRGRLLTAKGIRYDAPRWTESPGQTIQIGHEASLPPMADFVTD
jgi:hypothetical protein